MSSRLLLKILALASTCWMSVSQALAENRIALVIGNSNYASVSALPNPANDAKAMTKFLNSAGFQVLQAPNLKQADMRKTISNFAGLVAEKGPDTVALVYYAGHGLQVDGENYLVPVDASIQRETDVPLQAMRLADVMNAMSSVRSKTLLVLLDACRNNPFSDINKVTGRGLAIVDAPTGSLVSYSTAPGTEAQDGEGVNSPYTGALVKIAQEPGLPIEQALKRVRLSVNEATGRQQVPWESSSLTSEFAFFARNGASPGPSNVASAGSTTTPAAKGETRSVESWQKELKGQPPRQAYETVVREDKVEAYQAYLALYPSQSMAPVVRTIVDRRREMIAWYDAVTVNTVASYQAFLASYGASDFAATANRLVDRARMRSVSNGASAFASVGGTCPCSQPTTPSTPRQKRADVSPSDNPTGGAPTGGPVTSGPTIVGPVVTTPVVPVVPVYDPPVRIRDDWRLGRGHGDKPGKPGDKPTGSNGDKPTGGKPTGSSGDKPTGGKPTGSTGGNTGTGGRGMPSKTMGGKTYGQTGIAARGVTKNVTMNRSVTMNRPIMMNRGVSMAPRMTTGMSMGMRPSFGRMGGFGGMGGRRFF
jgi:uncharacterized caspase-like protein